MAALAEARCKALVCFAAGLLAAAPLLARAAQAGGGWPALEASPRKNVEVMGRGDLVTTDPFVGRKDLEFAFRADSTLGPAKGFVQFDDWAYRFTFTGTVRDVQVLAWTPDGSPREVRITGIWADRPGTDFTCVIVAPGKEDQGQLSLAIRGKVVEDVPLAPINGGYITMTGR